MLRVSPGVRSLDLVAHAVVRDTDMGGPMTINRLHLLWFLPALALPVGGTSTPGAALKCGLLAPDGSPMYAVDGVLQSREGISGFQPEDLYRVDIVCMDPKDSTFNRTAGFAVLSIWTMEGPAPRVPEALDIIRDAQDKHFAKYGRYIAAVEDIQLPESMKAVRITLNADENGWIAHSTFPRLLRRCVMFDGAVATPLAGEARESVCEPVGSEGIAP
jgi:hypothetical protein